MSSDLRQRAEALFHEALDAPASDRRRFVEAACGDDTTLRREVLSLLEYADAATFMHRSPIETLGLPEPSGPLPERFGNYRILRVLGQGGMGVVYEAQQISTDRPVALKVVRPGFASAALLRRFEHEVWVLGQLHHPGIAQIFEAGTVDTPAGPQPFFAMELIRGRPLNEYCATAKLGARARLALVADICDAVQHAHQKGVIHRDLKPGNIFVDESGRPKILDFGVARAMDSDLRTLQTDIGQLVGTVPYMSPEQVLGDSRQIDTRSDVYSLGVVLYELLADRLPYAVRDCSVAEAARRIRDEEPTRLGTAFRGDVQTIVIKALEKDRTRRYQSAAELAADIRRFLSDDPIIARPQTTLYQLRKFAKRHRGLVIGTSLAFAALVVGLISSTVLYLRADAASRRAVEARDVADFQRLEAERASAESAAVLKFFVEDMIGGAGPQHVGSDVTLIDLLEKAAPRIDERFAEKPRIALALHDHVGEIYRQLGRLSVSMQHRKQALALSESELGPRHVKTLNLRVAMADLLADAGRWDEVLALLQETYPVAVAETGRDSSLTLMVAAALGDAMQVLGRYDEAEPLLRETYGTAQKVLGNHLTTFRALNALNASLKAQGREDLELRRQEYEGTRATVGDTHPLTLVSLTNYSIALLEAKRPAEAAERLREVLDVFEARLPPAHPLIGELYSGYSAAVSRIGRIDDALDSARRAISVLSETLGERNPSTQRARRQLIRQLTRVNRFDEALQAVSDAVRARVLAGDAIDTPDLVQLQAEVAWDAASQISDCALAECLLGVIEPDGPRPVSAEDGTALFAASARAWCLLDSGKIDEAIDLITAVGDAAADAPPTMRGVVRWLLDTEQRLLMVAAARKAARH